MKTALPPAFLVVFFVMAPANGLAREDLLKKMVLSEYPNALRELESRFANASGSVRVVREAKLKSRPRPNESLYLFDSRRPQMARVRIQQVAEGANAGTMRVFCYNNDYAFLLQRGGDKREFYIKSIERNEKNTSHVKVSMQAFLDDYLDAPYLMEWFPVLTMFNDPNFSLRSVSPVIEKNKNMLRLAFDWPRPSDKSAGGGYEGSILVSPKEKWVLYEYEYRPKNGLAIRKGVIDYGEIQDGFPVPKRLVTSVFDTRKKALRAGTTYDFEEFRFVDLPEREFTLAAFGLPEGVLRPSRVARTSQTGYWLLGLAFMALAGSVALKYASSRRRRTAASGN